MTVTRIAACDWIIAWDAVAGRHRYLRHTDLVFQGDTILHVGPGYDGEVTTNIDGRGLMAMPGLVDLHTHPSLEPAFKGLREEHGLREHYMSGLYERCATLIPDPACQRAAATLAYGEMLRSGVTSVADLTFPYDGWREVAEASGLRVWMAAGFASARWYMDTPHQLKFAWDEPRGWREFEAAKAFLQDLPRGGRLSGIVYPMQIDTCAEDLLRAAKAWADEQGLPIATHISQSVMEFNEMVNRHGMTPVQWAARIGLLGPTTHLGHAIFIDEHSWLHWHSRRDLDLLAETGSVVAHCPNVFSRYGQCLEDFGRYRRAGVRIGLGTDTTPHNMIEEMRCAAILARVTAQDLFTTSTAEVLEAATVGGAEALGRPDLGRLAPGARADLVLVDLGCTAMRPVRDPLRSLVYAAAERAVRDVYVGGQKVVADGRVLTLDMDAAAAEVEEGQARMMAAVPGRDWAGRDIDTLCPLSLPI